MAPITQGIPTILKNGSDNISRVRLKDIRQQGYLWNLHLRRNFSSRIEALSCERQIKGWSRKKKEALIRSDWDEIVRLARKKNAVKMGK